MKAHSEVTLSKAGLKCLNEATALVMAVMVWKARQEMNPLGVCLFTQKAHGKNTRLAESKTFVHQYLVFTCCHPTFWLKCGTLFQDFIQPQI